MEAKRARGIPGDFRAQDPALQLFPADHEKVCAPQVNGLPARKALGGIEFLARAFYRPAYHALSTT